MKANQLFDFALFLTLFIMPISSEAQTWTNPVDGMKFVWIPDGSIHAEVQTDANVRNATREQTVSISGFWMGRYEVTIKQFKHFVNQTGYQTTCETEHHKYNWRRPGFKQQDNHPVVYVSLDDAQSYCDWAGVVLPTEAEWVYACRAGTNTRFYWGDEADPRYAWYRETAPDGTRPVGRKRPNPFGLHDTIGNVWEFVITLNDCFQVRGGSWTRCAEAKAWWRPIQHPLYSAANVRLRRCDPASIYHPPKWDDDLGFRCIKRQIAIAY